MSEVCLLDVSVLIALIWSSHAAHDLVKNWLAKYATAGWASCAITQAGFVRIISSPAFSPMFLKVTDAVALLELNLGHPGHTFWAMDVSFPETVRDFQQRLLGHQQVTDAYLLGLALHRGGRLVTLDKSLPFLLEEANRNRDKITVLSLGSNV